MQPGEGKGKVGDPLKRIYTDVAGDLFFIHYCPTCQVLHRHYLTPPAPVPA